MSRPRQLSVLILILMTAVSASAQVCHDGLWPDGEFCGYDSYVVTTGVDMNHDCVNDFLDNVMFFGDYGASGSNLSADLDGDGVVNISDVGLYTGAYDPFGTVTPCNPSPAYPDLCGADLALSLDPASIVSRGRLAGPGLVTVYVVASGWTNAGAIEYTLDVSPNVVITSDTSPAGWTKLSAYDTGGIGYLWDGRAFPATGTTVLVEHQIFIMDTQPAYIELIDSSPALTRWAPPTLDARTEFQVRRHIGINQIDPVSTTACPAANNAPTVAITDPAGTISVPYATSSYMVAGTAADSDSPLDFVEVRVNSGAWVVASGTSAWSLSVPLAVGENWIQVRAADTDRAYSQTQVITIIRQAEPVCHDGLWPDGEFCGYDSHVVTTGVDMNHDCVNDFLDNVMFFGDYGASGSNLSADLDGDGVVNISDVGLYTGAYDPFGTVTPCNPSPAYPDLCGADLALSLDPASIVSRGRLAGPGLVTVYVVASGWTNAGAIEYTLDVSPNVVITSDTSPAGWTKLSAYDTGGIGYLWDGRAFPATGTTVLVEHQIFIMDTQPAYIELIDSSPALTRWAPPTLDARTEFQVRRHIGINQIDPVSTTACPAANNAPTVAITDPAGTISVPYATSSYMVAGTAADSDSPLDFVEVRVNSGAWVVASGTSAWSLSVPLAVGENWIQVRAADTDRAYSQTQVVSIERLDQPDLLISAWHAPPDTTLHDGCLDLDVVITVRNDSGSASPATRVGYYLSADAVIDASDHFLDSHPVSALAVGGTEFISVTLTIPDDGPRGSVHLGAFVDDLGEVEESNEANNTYSIAIDYAAPAIISVVDVGNDQGRFVRLNVLASSRDVPSVTPVLQ